MTFIRQKLPLSTLFPRIPTPFYPVNYKTEICFGLDMEQHEKNIVVCYVLQLRVSVPKYQRICTVYSYCISCLFNFLSWWLCITQCITMSYILIMIFPYIPHSYISSYSSISMYNFIFLFTQAACNTDINYSPRVNYITLSNTHQRFFPLQGAHSQGVGP